MRESGRAATRALVLGVLGLGLLGMGNFGGGQTGTPARDFRATFTDLDGTRMVVTRVTAGGDTSLEGDLGRGRLRVPFDNIMRVALQPAVERDRMRADVTLRDGEPLALLLRTSITFYGQIPGGAYQIRARDLKSIEFAP